MTSKYDNNEVEATFEKEDEQQPIPPPDIVAYNELRSCADLFRMHATGKLEIQPDFQREVVWKSDDQTRFIDSLVKQLPIPSMCFSLDYKTQRWKVIDGLQRMSTIIRFLSTNEWKLSDLSDIHPSLRGVKNAALRNGSEEQKRLFSLVEDVSIPITVIRCDYTQPNHMLYLFTIFHRLNSGGVRLTNQEIRNCIYTGNFNNMLKRVDSSDANWKIIKKRIWGKTDRFRSVEIILRVLAFSEELSKYDGNLARFLNQYMHREAQSPVEKLAPVENKLNVVFNNASKILGKESQRKLTLAVMEALLVGLYVNADKLADCTLELLVNCYKKMCSDPSLSEGARYAVSNVENVKNRLNAAVGAFSV